MIDTFAKSGYKVTIFQTEDRYLLQVEDENYMLSWKLSKEIPLQKIKEKAIDSLLNQAKSLWPTLQENLNTDTETKSGSVDFPNII